MNYLFFGDLNSDEIAAINSGFEGSETRTYSLLQPESINFEDDCTQIYIFETIKLNFVSAELMRFVSGALAVKEALPEIKVVLIENMGDNGKVTIDWIKSVSDDFGLKINVVAEFDRQALREEIGAVLKILQFKVSSKLGAEIKSAMEHSAGTEAVDATKQNDQIVTIYTDGACSGNPGAGGWGAILMHGDNLKEISGYDGETTNNKMELTAVIKALSQLKRKCSVNLYSDSSYVVNAISKGWLNNWRHNGWIGSDKKPVKNIELWQQLDELLKKYEVNFHWVKGHADNPYNNRCDELATGEIKKHQEN